MSYRSQPARSSFEGIQPPLESPLSSWKCTKEELPVAAGVTAVVIYFGLMVTTSFIFSIYSFFSFFPQFLLYNIKN
jgi:hypothetical protein